MGYVIMIMAWSSGSLWIAGSDKISGYCERSEKRVTVNGVNSNIAGLSPGGAKNKNFKLMEDLQSWQNVEDSRAWVCLET